MSHEGTESTLVKTTTAVIEDSSKRQMVAFLGPAIAFLGATFELAEKVFPLITVQHPEWTWIGEAGFWVGVGIMMIRRGGEFFGKSEKGANFTTQTGAILPKEETKEIAAEAAKSS